MHKKRIRLYGASHVAPLCVYSCPECGSEKCLQRDADIMAMGLTLYMINIMYLFVFSMLSSHQILLDLAHRAFNCLRDYFENLRVLRFISSVHYTLAVIMICYCLLACKTCCQIIAMRSLYIVCCLLFCRYSLKSIDPVLMAPTCVFLASKVEVWKLLLLFVF